MIMGTRRGTRRIDRAQHALSLVITGDDPPSEFRIFAAGWNETTKGTFLFDAAAARSVLAEYKRHGIDLMLDYDHASLGSGHAPDPAQAGKAAGWFELEVRNGELWAVNVRWTPPAAEALRRREWRFMSPAFSTDDEGRITSLLNVALTNLPATRRLEPLMAASIPSLGDKPMLDAETVKKAIDALASGDAEAAMSILKDMIAAAASGEPSDDLPADPAPPAEELNDPPDEEEEEEEQAAVMAATSRLTRLTGKDTITAAVDEVEMWRKSHIELERERQKLAAERATLESAERRDLCVKLVTLAGRAPSTVWADPKTRKPKRYLEAMSIADLRDYVKDAIAARGKAPTYPVPPEGGGDGEDSAHGLTPAQLRICKETGCDPAIFAQLKKTTVRSGS